MGAFEATNTDAAIRSTQMTYMLLSPWYTVLACRAQICRSHFRSIESGVSLDHDMPYNPVTLLGIFTGVVRTACKLGK